MKRVSRTFRVQAEAWERLKRMAADAGSPVLPFAGEVIERFVEGAPAPPPPAWLDAWARAVPGGSCPEDGGFASSYQPDLPLERKRDSPDYGGNAACDGGHQPGRV